MNYWVHTIGRYRSTSILEKVHKDFFNYYQFDAMTYMRELCITMTKGMTATTAMGSHPTSQDWSASTLCSQQRPPSTHLTRPQPSTSSHPSSQDIPEACHSEKGSTSANL